MSVTKDYEREAPTSSSVRRENRRMAHRLWMGSMILVDTLHASANRVVFEYISMVLR